MKKKSIFICETCLFRNYHFYLSSNRDASLKLNKFCPNCRQTTVHGESK